MNLMKQIMMRMIITHKMKQKLLLICIIFVLLSFSVFAIKESETEFLTFNDKELALTILDLNDDGTVDVMLSEPIPIQMKSLDVGESQQYYSNWECFVATLVDVDGSKSDVYLSKCYSEEEDEIENVEVVDIETETEEEVETEEETETEEKVDIIINETEDLVDLEIQDAPPIEQYPTEGFFDKEVKLGNVLVIMLVMLIIVMIIMLSVIVYIKKEY
jgi:hypothetical protein